MAVMLSGCFSLPASPPAGWPQAGDGFASQALDTLLTRAERSEYRETTRHHEVLAFLEALQGAPGLSLSSFGVSYEGRTLPLARWNADANGERLRILIFANIHAGEVAGKEAALILLRELAQGRHSEWASQLDLIVAPIYNADGNEAIAYENRPLQHGPIGGMGTRANAQGLDLNRDFMKLVSPEGRALVGLMRDHDPHVIIDLHTTNGTAHAYHLTYAPSLHPDTPEVIDTLLRDAWLPAVTAAVQARTGFLMEYYGNFKPEWGLPDGWATFSHQARFGTNYAGLRGRIGILSEAYSYATFEDRVVATHAFVVELLNWAAANADDVRRTIQAADRAPLVGREMALRSTFATPTTGVIQLGGAVVEAHPVTGATMWRRTGEVRDTTAAIFGTFSPTRTIAAPNAYIIPASQRDVLRLLDAHGVEWEPVAAPSLRGRTLRQFLISEVRRSERPFQGVNEVQVEGTYGPVADLPDETWLRVPVQQPLGRLVVSLLEPEGDDGVVNWEIVPVERGEHYPILREEPRVNSN